MSDTFNEKFDKDIEKMKSYLLNEKLSAISFTYTDGWKFNLSITKVKLKKLEKHD